MIRKLFYRDQSVYILMRLLHKITVYPCISFYLLLTKLRTRTENLGIYNEAALHVRHTAVQKYYDLI